MRSWRGWIAALAMGLSMGTSVAQTLKPVLSNIEAPYSPLQRAAKLANVSWGAGMVNYGPAGTPLVLTGANLGGSGTVQFVSYLNGAVDNSYTVQATTTLWTSNIILVTVPAGARSGLVTVTVEGQTSNGLPYIVTPGTYAANCPVEPSNSQLQITASALQDGQVGQSYSATLTASGGTVGSGYHWSIASGSLPAGLSLSTGGVVSGSPTVATGSNPAPITFQVTDSGSPQQTDQIELALIVQPQVMTSGSIYSYSIGYDGAGNVTKFSDATYPGSGPGIMGTWGYTYDPLNRLATAIAVWPNGAQQFLCWNYDSFGNRQQQEVASAVFTGGGAVACSTSGGIVSTVLSSFDSNNRMTYSNARGMAATLGTTPGQNILSYDGSGNMTSDGENLYLYDAEGRVCAVGALSMPGQQQPAVTGYIYDGDGARVAKGTIPSATVASAGFFSLGCDPSGWTGFQFTADYVLGPSGEQLTQFDGAGTWQRTNIYAAGKLIGTYDLANGQPALHFHLADPLDTRRMQVSGMFATLGQPETDFQSLPFGDNLTSNPDPYAASTANDSTPLHFTGKERDAESGNDYFGARYYASAMGRFLSPDPLLNSGRPDDPQTWNRYTYALNNPLIVTDPTGLYNLVNTCASDNKQCNADFKTEAANLKSGVTALTKAVDGLKDGDQKTALQASLKALGTENDGNNVNVKFGATGDGSAAQTLPGSDSAGNLNFTITFDPSKNQGMVNQAINAAHEGTHVADLSDPRFNNPATTLSPFSMEYRGYRTSAYAAAALGQSDLSFKGQNGKGSFPIWNGSWGAVDKNITRYVSGFRDRNGQPDHPETTPHDPWSK